MLGCSHSASAATSASVFLPLFAMSVVRPNRVREQRIAYEIVVDACATEESAMDWYYYLEGKTGATGSRGGMRSEGQSPAGVAV